MSAVEKLDKLLRHAQSASESGDEKEAEAFLSRASAHAHRYHLELRISGDAERAPEHLARDSDIMIGTWRMRAYRWGLAWVVAGAHGCVPWLRDVYELGVMDGKFCTERVRVRAWLERSKRRDAQVRLVERDDGWVIEFSSMYAPPLSKFRIKAAARHGATRPGFELGSPERPLKGVDVGGQWDEPCELCDQPIYDGEAVYAIGPCHWSCHDTRNDAPELTTRGEPTLTRVLVMVGLSDIADAATYVYRSVLGDVDRLARGIAKGKGKTALNSARLGIVDGLRARMSKDEQLVLEAAKEAGDPGSAMVLAEAQEEATRYLADSYGTKPFGRARASEISIDGGSYSAGVEAAEGIDVPDPSGGRANLRRGQRALTSGE